jgi:hypothetical protein
MNNLDEKFAALISDLDQPEKAKIRAAVDALIALSGEASGLRGALERSLSDGQRKNHWAIAYVLGHLPEPSGAAIRHLLVGLDHREPDIRWAIALLLVRITKSEGGLVKLLLDLCRSGTVNQKRMAIYCIRDLQLNDDASMQELLAEARDEEPTVRVAAVTSLKTRPDADATARRQLLELFRYDEDLRVRNAAAITLAQLGAPSEDFMAALGAAVNGENAQLKKAATVALGMLKNKRSAPAGS